jgi:hypothetical protein
MKRIKSFELYENSSVKLSDLCEIKLNFSEADFWLQRNGSKENVGKPLKKFYHDNIGIKVISTDKLDPNYLYYYMQYLSMQGYFGKLASYTTQLHHIRVADIKNIKLNLQ